MSTYSISRDWSVLIRPIYYFNLVSAPTPHVQYLNLQQMVQKADTKISYSPIVDAARRDVSVTVMVRVYPQRVPSTQLAS